MRVLYLVISAFVFHAGMAQAHLGHVGEVAGHDHWIGVIAIGLAIGLAAWGSLADREDKAEDEENTESAEPSDAEMQDA